MHIDETYPVRLGPRGGIMTMPVLEIGVLLLLAMAGSF
jgi:hypothetical protein